MANDWAKIERYRDKERRELVVFTPCRGGEGKVVRGVCMLKVKGVHPQTKEVVEREQGFEFAFPGGTTVRRAMDTFDAVAGKAIKKYEEEQLEKQKERSIVAARHVPPLLGPGGKPMRLGG